MIDKTLQYIDYLKLLEVVQSYSSTQLVAERIAGLRPLSGGAEMGDHLDRGVEIEKHLDRLEETLDIIKWHGPIPLKDIPDVRDKLKGLALAESTLEVPDFLAIGHFLAGCKGVANFLKKALKKGPYIESVVEGMKPVTDAATRIRKTVNEEGFIEDSASYELSKIRSDLYHLKEKARRSLDRIMERDEVRPVLQDSYIAMRNGRYVIPLKPNYNQYFQGIVHDYSHSLKTSFVEPIEVIETNNSISVLEKEETEEEKRILKELTRQLRVYAGQIEGNLSLIADLDFFHSLALFSAAFGCVRPKVEAGGPIEIRGAVNPFILLSKGERAVPIDISIGEEKRATIISGPNADGKTVALKTTALLLVMASAGMFIPAKETPRVHLFPAISVIMGDEQNISMELSTFTAHVEAIKDVYERTRGGELVLIDEIGGATEPQEASALSMGIIDAFVEKGCKIIVTTHLNLLKAYGSSRPFALNVATDFDPKTMKPLYTLLYGVAGVSNALKVAEKTGLPSAILERSYSYLGKQEYVLNDLIEGLEREKKEAEEEKRKAREYREEMRKRLEALKDHRDEYVRESEERARRKIIELDAEIEEIRKEAAKRDRESVRAAKQRVSEVRKRIIPEKKGAQAELRVGDYVRVRTIGKEGYVTVVDEEKRMAEIIVGNMRMRINKDYVEKALARPAPKEERTGVNVSDIEVPEINVRGMRVEEALVEVDRFVDRAIVHGTPRLKILHGIGTGRLMTAIRSHLSEAGYVKDVIKDEKNSGITIVELL
ncbi:MAG: Smr/MutS family protein [Syntrophorhabdales bacterium]|jgi:DNA mismatch repair protein MutS2